MTAQLTLSYLARAFDRLRAEALLEAQMSRQRIVAEATKTGLSGRTIIQIKDEYVRIVRESAHRMCRHAFDATGDNVEDIAEVIQNRLVAVRDDLSNDLADFFRKGGSWAGQLGQAVGNEYLDRSDKIISGTVDDFNHGILEGRRLTKNPLVSVISSITNSPGAVMQSGVGNVQEVLSAERVDELRDAIAALLGSKEVQGLSPDEKSSVTDVADVMSSELSKPNPDVSRLARWGARLAELAEKVGISVAASGVSKALFG
jgi:hypothetical protein